MTPAPRPFSGDTEDASKSQNPLAQSARTQTLIPLMMFFLGGMYCLTLDRPMNCLINCVVAGGMTLYSIWNCAFRKDGASNQCMMVDWVHLSVAIQWAISFYNHTPPMDDNLCLSSPRFFFDFTPGH